jgi:hypothetical protein
MAVWSYSKTAGSNTTLAGVSAAEGMSPASVNNLIRAIAADIKSWQEDIGGANTTTGSLNAYLLTTDSTLAALADGVMVAFIANHTNTGAATLAVDGLTAKAIRKDGDDALAAGNIVDGGLYMAGYDASANSAAGAWLLLNPAVDILDDDNTWSGSNVFNLDTAGTAPLTVRATEDGASLGPILKIDRLSASAAASDVIGAVYYSGRNSSPANYNYARIYATIVDPTNATEDSRLAISTSVAGSLDDCVRFQEGVYHGSATGGDKGANTLNFGTLYANGVSISPIGKHTIWVPATAMTPRSTNGPAAGTVETTSNKVMIKTLDFSTSTREFAQFTIGMPKSWNESTVTFIPVWSHPATTVNFGVAWSLAGLARSNSDPLDTAFGTVATVTDTGGTTNDLYIGAESSAITIGGTPAESDVVWFQIDRTVANASDNMAVDARLHGVKIILTTDAATDD